MWQREKEVTVGGGELAEERVAMGAWGGRGSCSLFRGFVDLGEEMWILSKC